MHTRRSVLTVVALSSVLLVAAAPGAWAADGELRSSSFVSGDFLVTWRSGGGTTIAYRGVPLFAANPSEIIVHREWEDVYYRTNESEQTAALSKGPGGTTLTVRDRSEHFRFARRTIAGPDGAVRLEYEYEVLQPEEAEMQVLFGVGGAWLDGAKYRTVIGGSEDEGELTLPETGRTDPWSGATEQTFVTDYGTLTVSADRGLNLLCRPDGGAMWWAQALTRGETYRTAIDVQVESGPATETGVVLGDLGWSRRVRSGRATFRVGIAREPDGPRSVTVQAQPTSAAGVAGRAVEVALSEEPRTVRCSAAVEGRGERGFELVLADAATGEELLRLGPLALEADPYLRAMPRLSLYTHERRGEIMVTVAEDMRPEGLSVIVDVPGSESARRPVAGRKMSVPVELDGLPEGVSEVRCQLLREDDVLGVAETQLRVAPPKPNEVKIDNATGGLIADGLPFVPFGYYTYFPLTEGVMDEEVVRGFTLFSPYHGGPHDAEELDSIRAYMDRCAEIGMRVNYHLMWARRREMTDELWSQLRAEIEAFRDHPALLSWYIADEPSSEEVPRLERVYDLVRDLDPHHPVTVVFYRGAEHARQFEGCMDIVMGDPYPIPHGSVTYVSEMADALRDAFDGRKALWIVPQAFGGHEWWKREPTAQEERVMTYLALIHGARGIQYFIRSPRVSFPKSPVMWAECGTLALETAELTPALTSAEPRPAVESSSPGVHVGAYRDRGAVTVLAANTKNEPQPLHIELGDLDWSGEARVLFENRTVTVEGGAIAETIDAYDTRAYRLQVAPGPADELSVHPDNLTINPSWEHVPSVGTPASCYAHIGPGATAFVDARLARHGSNCLRMTLPDEDSAVRLRPYPFPVEEGQTYRISTWGRALQGARALGVELTVELGGFGERSFELTSDWREYTFDVTPDSDARRGGLAISLTSPGTAWVDLLQVVPVEGE